MSLLNTISRRFALTLPALATVFALTTLPATQVSAEGFNITEQDRVFGDADAPNTFIEYASMTCPHCARFHDEGGLYQKIKEQFVVTGQAKFVYRDLPWDGMAFRAALMARCLPESKYEAMVSRIYNNQASWSSAPEELLKLFAITGMTAEEAEACVNDKRMQEYILKKRTEALDVLKVTGTPFLFLNGKKVNMQNSEEDEILENLASRMN